MATKIFFALLALSLVVMSFFVFYAWSWLGSIGDPRTAAEGFEYHSRLATVTLWSSSIVLLAVGNVILWTRQNAWALWVTFAYFAVFTIVDQFWLGSSFAEFRSSTGLSAGAITWGPLVGALYVIGAACVTLADHFVVVRLSRKLYPSKYESTPAADEAGEPIPEDQE